MTTLLEKIESVMKEQGLSWQSQEAAKSYASQAGEDGSNFKRKMDRKVTEINKALEPLGLELDVKRK